MPICPSCARELRDGIAFCGYCGTNLVAGQDQTQAVVGAMPPQSYWVCPHCSGENTDDAAFCSSCGAGHATVRPPDRAAFVPAQPMASAPAPRSGHRWWLLAVALVVVAAVGAGFAFYLLRPSGDSSGGNGGTATGGTTSGGGGTGGTNTGGGSGGGTNADAEIRAFLQGMEDLIRLAGEGYGLIGKATTGYRKSDLSQSEAAAMIQRAIDNRQAVLDGLANLTVPDDATARRCHEAFAKAMRESKSVDQQYLDWVDFGAAEPTTLDNLPAAGSKEEFVSLYNGLAADHQMRHDWESTDI